MLLTQREVVFIFCCAKISEENFRLSVQKPLVSPNGIAITVAEKQFLKPIPKHLFPVCHC